MRVAALVLVCAALAACGASAKPVAGTGPASAPSPAGTPTVTAGGSTASTPATGAATTSTPTTSMPTATVSPPATTPIAPAPAAGLCTASRLALSVLSAQGAAGHSVIAVGLRNRSSQPCHAYGFPGVRFLSAYGSALATDPTRVTTDFAGPAPERPITLMPGQSASFRLVISHVSSGPLVCHTAHALQVIAPDDTEALRTALPSAATECGEATVSPLQPGRTATPGQ